MTQQLERGQDLSPEYSQREFDAEAHQRAVGSLVVGHNVEAALRPAPMPVVDVPYRNKLVDPINDCRGYTVA